jgi:hypothetical protein
MTSERLVTDQLAACHRQLDELFLLHQEALVQGHLEDAISILLAYNACHTLHSEFEDDVLIPAYANLEAQGKWNATLYEQEHQKINDLYSRIEQDLVCLSQQSLEPSQSRRNIIHLLDREKSFKGLCEHHQEREEASLLVELDQQLDCEWREETANLFSSRWKQILDYEMEKIRELI